VLRWLVVGDGCIISGDKAKGDMEVPLLRELILTETELIPELEVRLA